MDEPTFWDLIQKLNWDHEGNDDKVVEPVIDALASLRDSEIAAFQNTLSTKLYDLDGRAWARESGETTWLGGPDKLSVDGFLYARCAVVAKGQAFYDDVLRDPTHMPKDTGFEALLYVASTAYERKTGLDAAGELDESDVSFETFSNEAGWPKLT